MEKALLIKIKGVIVFCKNCGQDIGKTTWHDMCPLNDTVKANGDRAIEMNRYIAYDAISPKCFGCGQEDNFKPIENRDYIGIYGLQVIVRIVECLNCGCQRGVHVKYYDNLLKEIT